jgi:short-subunit dehydrogenase
MPIATALVTGASAGLGREIVRQLVREHGLKIVLATARRRDRLESLAAEFAPGTIRILDGDLADPGFRARLWAEAEALPGGCDLVVNNAGLGDYALFDEQDPEAERRMIEVNIVALMDLTRRAIGHMKARGERGQIMQVSSVLGFVGMPYSAVYTATKHAVNGLVKSVRYELRGTGIDVWAACPSRTESEFQAVATGKAAAEIEGAQRFGTAEPTEKVVRGMLRGLKRRGGRLGFVFPTMQAWGVVEASAWMAWPFDWVMRRFSAGWFRSELESAREKPAGG